MANVIIDNIHLINIANAIREKNGSTDTYKPIDMPQAILDIVSDDSSAEYSDMVYNENNTITLTETTGTVHTMECEYSEDGRLTSVKYDGKTIDFTYEGDVLVSIGSTAVDMANVPTEIGSLESLIDNSGVLDSTEGTATQKVEQLIDKVEYELKAFENITTATSLFKSAKIFPTKAVVNLPNANGLYQAFSYWNTEPIPIVEELAVNGSKITNIGQMFYLNKGVKKVILNISNECNSMASTFGDAANLEEIILNLSTKNITDYGSAFAKSKTKRILGVLDFSSATNVNYMFANCYSLREVTFAPNTLSISLSLSHSGVLTIESIQSIIDGLATVETAQTLTLHKDIVLTDEQKATINAKGWTLAQ